MSDSTKRRRVPISCLNCRRRKVKCDKVKPICGGCVRNGVADSCEYLDPHWINNGDNSKKDLPNDNKLTELEALKEAKAHNEKLLASQRKEIDDLKRQLSFSNQLNTDHSKESSSSSHLTIDILKNLNIPDTSVVEVNKLIYLSLKPGQNQKLIIKNIYSWISIIRLDPKLTCLWSKIGNMQKLYHSFKVRKDLHDLNKCPVSNIHLKDEPNDWANSPVPPINKTITNYSPEGFHLMILIQKLFRACMETVGKPLTYDQYNFLLDFYFRSQETSSRLTSFFKEELRHIVQLGDGNHIQLAISAPREMNGLHIELHQEETKSILTLLGMLLIVLEESLNLLRENVRNGLDNAEMSKFKEYFPEVDVTVNKIPDNSLNLVQEVILNCMEGGVQDERPYESLSIIACILLVIHCDISDHSRDNYKDYNIKYLFDNFLHTTKQLLIWRSPSDLILTNSGKKKSKDVKIYMTQLWNEILRIMNLACFSLVTVKFSDEFDESLRNVFHFIDKHSLEHINYLQGLKNNDLESLVSSLKINTSLIKAHINLQRGIELSMGPELTIGDLDILSSDLSSWTTDTTIKNLPNNLRVEFRIMVHLSSAYLMFLMFVQSEQSKDFSLRDHISVGILGKMSSFIKSTNILISTLNEERYQYLLSGIVEQFTVCVQIIIAILMRLINRKVKPQQDELYKKLAASCSVCGNLSGTSGMKELFKEQIMDYIDKLLSNLQIHLKEKNHIEQLITLWNFYKSLINSVEKFDINYRKYHSNVPEFKIIGGDFNKCPISHADPGKCPVDHSKFTTKTGTTNKPEVSSSASPTITEKTATDFHNGTEMKENDFSMSFDFNFETMMDLLPMESSGFSAMNFDFLRDSSFSDLTASLNLDFLDDDPSTKF